MDGVKIAELTIDKVGPVPDLLKGIVPNWIGSRARP
jgi:hypothetical protein